MNVTPIIFDELKQLIEEKFEAIKKKITSAEKHMKDQHQELLNLIKETDKWAKAALEFAHSNTELITDNSEKTSNQDFQIEEMSNQIHCVKCVQIRSFFWSVFSLIRTEYGEYEVSHLVKLLHFNSFVVIKILLHYDYFNKNSECLHLTPYMILG